MKPQALIESAVSDFLARKNAGASLLDPNFPHQMNAILDPSKRKAIFCTRRAAKSYTDGLALVQAAKDFPGCNVLYIGLTRLSAKGIVWKDILKRINREHHIGMLFNETELTATLPNGSIIYLTGIDANEDEMEKLLGKKWKRVVCDEASLYSVDLRKFCYGIIGPALVDEDGDLILSGTSSDMAQGLFFDITQGKEDGWKVFTWTAYDNPYISEKWAAEIEDIKRNRPEFMKTPLFRQWYLNEWVIDENKLVYRYQAGRNDFEVLPSFRTGSWEYVLGVDLGYDPDPSAFVLCAFHEHDPTLYILECEKKTQMDVTDVANRIKRFQSQFPITKVIIDGSNKQAVEEMQRRHDIALTAADKREKADFIQLMNGDLIQGKIKLSSQCEELKKEAQTLIWVVKDDQIVFPRKENPNCANHLCDAWLYAWRYCYPFMATPQKPVVNLKQKDQYLAHTQKLMEEHLQNQIDREQAEERGEDIFNTDTLEENEVLSYYLNKRRA